MKLVKIKETDKSVDFITARRLADEQASNILGDHMNISWYDKVRDLSSPERISCKNKNEEACFSNDYAKSFDASLEVDVGNERLYRFFYRPIDNYLS